MNEDNKFLLLMLLSDYIFFAMGFIIYYLWDKGLLDYLFKWW